MENRRENSEISSSGDSCSNHMRPLVREQTFPLDNRLDASSHTLDLTTPLNQSHEPTQRESSSNNTIDDQPISNYSLPNPPTDHHQRQFSRDSREEGYPWCQKYEQSSDRKKKNRRPRKRENICFKLLRLFWSFSAVFLVTLLTTLILVGVSVWLFNYFVILGGVRNVAIQHRDILMVQVMDHVNNFVSKAPLVVQAVTQEMRMGDVLGYNFSNSRIEKSRKIQEILLFSQLKNPMIYGVWYGTHYNYFTGLTIDDNRSPPRQYLLGLSNGDGTVQNFQVNNQLNRASNATFVSTDYYPTKRPWYTPAETTRTIQWGKAYPTVSSTPLLMVSVSGPYFDVHNGSFYGVLTAGVNLESLSDYLSSLSVFPRTRIFIVQLDMLLVGVNYGDTINNFDPAHPTMIDARNSSDLVIRETAQKIVQRNPLPLQPQNLHPQDFKFKDSTGISRLVGISCFQDSYDLSWVIVSVLSESVVLQVVDRSNRVLVIVTICTIIGALLIGFIISVIVSVPLYEISREFVKITRMNFGNRKHKIHSLSFFEIEVMTNSTKQLKNGLRCFYAYVPSYVVRVLMTRNASAKLGVVRRRMTIVFIETSFDDANGFSADILVEMLQIVFTAYSQIVTEEGGVIDKYLSEGIMCLFNAPLNIGDHELRSIRACRRISQRTEELNEEWRNNGYPCISIQMGVNTDMCYVGNVGSRSRVNYTALGDAVNVASRLMSLNKRYDTTLMIGPKTKEAVQEQFVCRWISFVCVKGKSQPIHVFEVLSEREQATEKQKELESATCQVSQLIEENNLDSAHSLVLKLLSEYPRDKPLIELKERLEAPSFDPFLKVGHK